jgi:hypothetical protein
LFITHTLLKFFFALQIVETGEKIGLKHFKPVKPLGCGDTGRYNSLAVFYTVWVSKVFS